MSRPTSPPTMEFFADRRPPLGPRRVSLRLSDVELELLGLDEELARRFFERFGRFAHETASRSDALRVRMERDDRREYYIDPPARPELNPVWIACDGDRVRYLGYRLAGWFDVDGGEGRVLLASGSYEPAIRALENYLRAAVAWRAASRGGALIHAASAVLRGAGYLFYGESGAGKSTLSEVNRRARIVSDDLSLVLPGTDGALELVGSPFRGTYEGGEPVLGRFPLRAGFRIVQDRTAEVREVPRSVALSELVGNLPFVAEAFFERPDLFERIEAAFRAVPLARLHFRKDESYWDAIARAGR